MNDDDEEEIDIGTFIREQKKRKQSEQEKEENNEEDNEEEEEKQQGIRRQRIKRQEKFENTVDKVIQYTNQNKKKLLEIVDEDKPKHSHLLFTPSNNNKVDNNTNVLSDLTRSSIEKLQNGMKITYGQNVVNVLTFLYDKLVKEKKLLNEELLDESIKYKWIEYKKILILPLSLNYTEKIKNINPINKELIRIDHKIKNKNSTLDYYGMSTNNDDTKIYYSRNNLSEPTFTNMLLNEEFTIKINDNFFNESGFTKESAIILFQRTKYTFKDDKVFNEYHNYHYIMLNGKAIRNCTDFVIISVLDKEKKHFLLIYSLITEMNEENVLAHYLLIARKRMQLQQIVHIPKPMVQNFTKEYVYKEISIFPVKLRDICINVESNECYISKDDYDNFLRYTKKEYQDIVLRSDYAVVMLRQRDDEKYIISIPYANIYFPNIIRDKEGKIVSDINEMIKAKFVAGIKIRISSFQLYDDNNEQIVSKVEEKDMKYDLDLEKTVIWFTKLIPMNPNQTIYIVFSDYFNESEKYKFALNLLSFKRN